MDTITKVILREGDTVEYRVGINYLEGEVVEVLGITEVNVRMKTVEGPTFTRNYKKNRVHTLLAIKLRKVNPDQTAR